MVNMLKYKLNGDQTSVLIKGLNYAVSNTPDTLAVEDVVVATV